MQKLSSLHSKVQPKGLSLNKEDVFQLVKKLHINPLDIEDFSTNSNFLAKNITENIISSINCNFAAYPDPSNLKLRKAIAKHEQVASENVIIGSGASELIFLSLQALKPEKVLLIAPISSEYENACHNLGIETEILALSAKHNFNFAKENLKHLWNSQSELAVFCIPNNPTGLVYENISLILETIPCSRLLIDTSYREFIYQQPGYKENTWINYMKTVRLGVHILTLSSFSNFFHCAGIRLGYAVSDKTIINRLSACKAPWTVSAFAEETGLKFLEQIEEYRKLLPMLQEYKTLMLRELAYSGIFNIASINEGPNFITLSLQNDLSNFKLREHLLKHHILIKICDDITAMPKNYVRIQVRSPEQCQKLYAALNSFL